MHLSEIGKLAQMHWFDLPNHFNHVDLDAFVVMPNHIHGIIVLIDQSLADGIHAVPTSAANSVGTRSVASVRKKPQPLGGAEPTRPPSHVQ
jgi:putative transposase